MTDWLIPSQPATFDIDSAYQNRDHVDWSEVGNARLQPGDRAFLYQASPVQAITHVCEVTRIGIPSSVMLDDSEYWRDADALAKRRDGTWMRLRLLRALTEGERVSLTLKRLHEEGLKHAPPGRMRASAAVSALVEEVLEESTPQPEDLIERERDLIADLGIERASWRFRRGQRGGTSSHESFVYALSMPEAPVAVAMLRAYVDAVSLGTTDQWAISAMPSWAGPTDTQRFATISSGNIELFYVWFESVTGEVTEWGIRLPRDLVDRAPMNPDLWHSNADNGDRGIHGETLDALLLLLEAPGVTATLSEAYERRQGLRRRDWHNPYLGALLGASSTPRKPELTEPTTDEDVEFERRYIERTTRQRLHQGRLRRAALKRYGAQCMYCGLDVPEVLEAAHIIADRKGGAASTDNVRILCANHHSAFDAGLLRFDGERFTPAPGAPEVLPYEATSASISDVDRLL